MANPIEIIALIIEAFICFGVVAVVAVIYVRRERTSTFKSNDPSMFYPNDALYGEGWNKKLTPEEMKKYTSAYTASLAEYNAGAE